MEFSIIVPVYNAEKYLPQCLASIKRQSFTEYEVILVDDGADDASAAVCQEYARQDKRFCLYRKENGGSSTARNYGMQYAKGTYVVFIDSDDTISDRLLEQAKKQLEQSEADVYMYGYRIIQNKELSVFCPEMQEGIYHYESEIERFRLLMELLYFKYAFSACNKIYRRELLEKYHVTFPERVRIGEDLGFNMKYFLHCHTICTTNDKMYEYHIHEASAMQYDKDRKPCLDDFVLLAEDSRQYFQKYAPPYVKKHFAILYYEEMNNQYYDFPDRKVLAAIRSMKYRRAHRRGIRYILRHGTVLVQYYGFRRGYAILLRNVRYFVGI